MVLGSAMKDFCARDVDRVATWLGLGWRDDGDEECVKQTKVCVGVEVFPLCLANVD